MGRYVLLEELGRGGMGVVFMAYDPHLDRRVALKVLRVEASGQRDATARLQQEGRAIAKLAHPNVVAVFDVGTEDGNTFVAMELVDGGSLDRWLDAEPRSWREVIEVFLQAGEGLAAAHVAGLIHRDFKPANVLIGSDGRVRVTDFGLARTVGEGDRVRGRASDRDVVLTHSGALVGTPAYMSPEQFAAAPLDARSDQFSFAVSLYEGLFGERPFAGTTIGELRDHIASGDILPPPPKTTVPAWVRDVVVRALAADPTARYEDMAGLIAALRRDSARRRRIAIGVTAGALLIAGSVTFAATTARREAVDPCKHAGDLVDSLWNSARINGVRAGLMATGRPYAAATAQTVVGKLGDFASSWSLARRETCAATRRRGERSEALLDRRMICLERQLATFGARVSVLDVANGAAPIDRALDIVDGLPPPTDCADDAALLAESPLTSDRGVRAKVAKLEGELAEADALHDGARDDRALAKARAVVASTREVDVPGVLGRALCTAADAEASLAQLEQAESDFTECALVAARAHDARTEVDAWLGLVDLLVDARKLPKDALRLLPAAEAAVVRAGDSARARSSFQLAAAKVRSELGEYAQAVTLVENAQRARPEHDDEVQAELAAIWHAQGRFSDSLDLFSQVLAVRERKFGREHPYTLQTLQNVALAEQEQGNYEQALAKFEDALTREQRVVGPRHPDVARTLVNIATVKLALGRLDEARTDTRRAMEMLEATVGREHADVATALANYADMIGQRGEFRDALATYERAREIRKQVFGAESRWVAGVDAGMGRVYYLMGDLDNALLHVRRALPIEERILGSDHPDVGLQLSLLGIIELDSGKLGDSEEHLRRALAIKEATLGADHPDIAYDAVALSSALLKGGNAAGALPFAERAYRIRTASNVEPFAIAESKFYLAQALWAANKDRSRASALVNEARPIYAAAGPGLAGELAKVDRWIATKRPQ